MRLLLIFVWCGMATMAYSQQIWSGGSSGNWTGNWSGLPTGIRTFALGGNIDVSNVPSITFSKLNVINNSHVSLSPPTTSSSTISLLNVLGDELYIEPGSSLTIKNNSGQTINLTIGGTLSQVEIGGILTLEGGNFDLGNNTLLLHTSTTPINGLAGTFTLGPSARLEFGEVAKISGGLMIIPDDIFSSYPEVEDIVLNRTNGVQLGNQPITVTEDMTFILGNIMTSDNGRLKFSTAATNPPEIDGSAIIGYAEMEARAINTGALDFLGLDIAAGENIGDVSVVRRTGSVGENTLNGNSSVLSSWDISVSNEPAITGRQISLGWLPEMDNSMNVLNDFQIYEEDGTGSWDGLGSPAALNILSGWRITASVTLLSLSTSFTVADENNVLPVTLADLKANVADDQIYITWQTLSEIQNDYFILEKRLASAFSPIGKIGGAGNSNDLIQYKGVDNDPSIGQNVYRLKQVDLDGSITYYGPVSCDYRSGNLRLEAYPNPVINGAASYVMFTADDELIMNLRLVNYLGQEFMNKEIKSNEEYALPSAERQNGMYKLIATDPLGQKITKSIVISD